MEASLDAELRRYRQNRGWLLVVEFFFFFFIAHRLVWSVTTARSPINLFSREDKPNNLLSSLSCDSGVRSSLSERFLLLEFHTHMILKYVCSTADYCRTLDFVHHFVRKALKRHLIRNISTPNCELCQIECFAEKRCVSYNCRRLSCELNSADHIEHPEDLEDEERSDYHAAEVCRLENMFSVYFRKDIFLPVDY